MITTTKIDVLAVISAAIAGMEGPVRERRGHRERLIEARAVVAELIQAVTDCVEHGGREVVTQAIAQARVDRLRAVLVRARGEGSR